MKVERREPEGFPITQFEGEVIRDGREFRYKVMSLFRDSGFFYRIVRYISINPAVPREQYELESVDGFSVQLYSPCDMVMLQEAMDAIYNARTSHACVGT